MAPFSTMGNKGLQTVPANHAMTAFAARQLTLHSTEIINVGAFIS